MRTRWLESFPSPTLVRDALQLLLLLLLLQLPIVITIPRCDGYTVKHTTTTTASRSTPATTACRTNDLPIESYTWTGFRGHPVAYERAVIPGTSAITDQAEPVIILNGFGVGSFHQHRLISVLWQKEREIENRPRMIFGMDYLGQGRSWPVDCQDGESLSERGLRYCGSTWMEQILDFIEQVVLPTTGHSKVHLVGNSVGGHLAVFCAAQRPDLVLSVTLLNATPVWGLNLPGWSGHLPAPFIPKWIGRYLFDRIRDISTIIRFLENCYANPQAYDHTLVQQIRSCTEGDGGHAAFASILWSPPVTATLPDGRKVSDYATCLETLQCDVLLIFGRDDPWCTPVFAKRMLQQLTTRDPPIYAQRYVELSGVGHCPNHEAPNAVATLLSAWWNATTDDRSRMALVDENPSLRPTISESWGETVLTEVTIPRRSTSGNDRWWWERAAGTVLPW